MQSNLPTSAMPKKALIAACFVALALGGCEHLSHSEGPQVAGWSLMDPSQNHPITISQQPQTMSLRIAPGSRGLSESQYNEVLRFANRARVSDAGNSRLVVSAPSGGAHEVASMYAVHDIRQILSDHGFADSAVAVEAYDASRDRNAPVKISYLRYVAEGPNCGTWPTNLANQRNNAAYQNFGCANQHNLAAMIANPADLLGPRTETDRVSERRDVTWDKYTKGETTGAEKSQDEKISTQGE